LAGAGRHGSFAAEAPPPLPKATAMPRPAPTRQSAKRPGRRCRAALARARLRPQRDVEIPGQQSFQIMLEFGHLLVALVAVLLKRAHDHAVNCGRYAQLGPKLRRRHGFLREHLRDHPQVVVGAKGNFSRQHSYSISPRSRCRPGGPHRRRPEPVPETCTAACPARSRCASALQCRPLLARLHGLDTPKSTTFTKSTSPVAPG